MLRLSLTRSIGGFSVIRQSIVEGGLKVLREMKPEERHLEQMFIACLPAVREAARLVPDISDQLER